MRPSTWRLMRLFITRCQGGVIPGAGDEQLDPRLPTKRAQGTGDAGEAEVGEVGDHQPQA